MTRLGVLALFSGQYLLMAYLACLGAIQIAAARSGRRHLWLLPRRTLTRSLGWTLVVGGILLFYLVPLWTAGPWGPPEAATGAATWAPATWETLPSARNINDTAGGLSGHWQALWFSLAWVLAALTARAAGRIRQRSSAGRPADLEEDRLVGAGIGPDHRKDDRP